MTEILVTGVGSLLGQGILKSLANSSLKYSVSGTDYFPSAVGLYWVDKGFILPDILDAIVREEDWIKALIEVIESQNIQIVLPGLDFEIPLFAKYREFIEEETGAIVVVSPKEVVRVANDKWETVRYLNANGFCTPYSCLPKDIANFLECNSLPLIVKPRFGNTSKNVSLARTEADLEKAIENCPSPIIQQYLDRSDAEYTCGATYLDNEVATVISLRRTLKNGNTYEAFCEETPVIDQYIEQITRKIKPLGPINFQLRLTEIGPVIFEINARFSGSTPLRAEFGINEVEVVIRKLLGEEPMHNYEERHGVIVRYLENQFISWEQYESHTR